MAENAGGFMGGLAEGLQQGTNMGYLRMQAQAMQQNQQRQMMYLEQQAKMEERKQKQAEAQSLITFYRGLSPKARVAWRPTLSASLNDAYGTDLTPEMMTEQMDDALVFAGNVFDRVKKGEIDENQALKEILPIYTRASEASQATLKETMTQLSSMSKTKSDGKDSGSFAFQGWGPDGKPVFTNTKSTQFFGPDGKPAAADAQTFTPKTELPKLGEQIRQAEANFNTFKDITGRLDKVASGPKGALQKQVSKASFGLAYPSQKALGDQMDAYAVSMYRDITGDTRLSDADAKARAKPFMPSSSESKEVQKQKIKAILDAYEWRLGALKGKRGDPNAVSPQAKSIIASLSGPTGSFNPDEAAVLQKFLED